jgi:hypothetical protein
MAKWAIGRMDAANTVPVLNNKDTPVIVSHDQTSVTDDDDRTRDVPFAKQGEALGASLTQANFTNVKIVDTKADHEDHSRAAWKMGPELKNMVG